jgi:hypothetical protein
MVLQKRLWLLQLVFSIFQVFFIYYLNIFCDLIKAKFSFKGEY